MLKACLLEDLDGLQKLGALGGSGEPMLKKLKEEQVKLAQRLLEVELAQVLMFQLVF